MPDNQPPKRIVAFTVLVSLTAAAAFALKLWVVPDLTSTAGSNATPYTRNQVFLLTVGLMFAAGTVGGCLYAFRGLIKHSAEDDFTDRYLLSYYLRPFAGGLSGTIVFFLLLGGVLTLTDPGTSGAPPSWGTSTGRLPYIALSLLAGYGSNESMLKMKDLAQSLFALQK